jgi:hypothetical protein
MSFGKEESLGGALSTGGVAGFGHMGEVKEESREPEDYGENNKGK